MWGGREPTLKFLEVLSFLRLSPFWLQVREEGTFPSGLASESCPSADPRWPISTTCQAPAARPLTLLANTKDCQAACTWATLWSDYHCLSSSLPSTHWSRCQVLADRVAELQPLTFRALRSATSIQRPTPIMCRKSAGTCWEPDSSRAAGHAEPPAGWVLTLPSHDIYLCISSKQPSVSSTSLFDSRCSPQPVPSFHLQESSPRAAVSPSPGAHPETLT